MLGLLLEYYARKKVQNIDLSQVTRFEVIESDDTGRWGGGRVYVVGPPYSSAVSLDCSLQDEGRTLKVFVKRRTVE